MFSSHVIESVEKSGTGLLPLTLGAPLVSVFHAVHFAAFPDLASRLLVERGFGGDGVEVRFGGLSLMLVKTLLWGGPCHADRRGELQ